MDFSKVKFSCSMLGVIMSEPEGALTDKMFNDLESLKKKHSLTPIQEENKFKLQYRFDNYDPKSLSAGCKKYLLFVYSNMKYGKAPATLKPGKGVRAMIRGSQMEKTSFEIVKRVTGYDLHRFKKNVHNGILKGRLDVIDGDSPEYCKKVIDIKTSYSQFDFMQAATSDLKRSIDFQLQGYMELMGKDLAEAYYVLTDFTDELIDEQKEQMKKLLCPDGFITQAFIEEWEEAERGMRYGHIPEEERIISFKTERDEKIIDKIYEKADFCREYLAKIDEKHNQKIADQLAEWQKSSFSK